MEWFDRLKCRATGLDASLSFRSTSRRCSRKRSPNLLSVSPMSIFLFYAIDNIAEVHVKRSVILIGRLGLVTLSVLCMKGQVLHLFRVRLKVPGDSSDFSVLPTKTSLVFLLRLNETSTCFVVILKSLEVLQNDVLDR